MHHRSVRFTRTLGEDGCLTSRGDIMDEPPPYCPHPCAVLAGTYTFVWLRREWQLKSRLVGEPFKQGGNGR